MDYFACSEAVYCMEAYYKVSVVIGHLSDTLSSSQQN